MPIDCAATSLPRSARRVRPTVPSRIRRTATDTTARTTTASTRNARSSPKSHGPSTGRGTRVPWSREVPPPPTHESFTITASKKKAKARVAMATQIPPRRRTGSDSSAPATRGDDGADEGAGEHRDVVAVGELEGGEAAHRRERALAQGDLAGEAGDDRDRQVDRGHDHRLGDEEQPGAVGPGEDDVADGHEEHDGEGPGGGGEARPAAGGHRRRRRRIDPGQRVRHRAGPADLRRQHQHAEEHHERDRRGEVVLEHLEERVALGPAGQERVEEGDEDAEAEPADERPRQADQQTDRRRGDGDHHQVEEVRGHQGVEPRGDEDPGHPGEGAGQGPGERRHAVGRDAVQLGHPGALDHRPHLQADRGEPEQRPQATRRPPAPSPMATSSSRLKA